MARGGGKRRTYVRDSNGRFASTPGGGPKRPATKAVKRGPNRLTRDNSGRITSVGGDGATVRGGRLKTAAGNLRGRQVAKGPKQPGVQAGTLKGRKVVAGPTTLKATPIKPRVPAAERPGSITNTLRGAMRSLAQADAKRIRDVEAITGQKIRAPKSPPPGAGATVRSPGNRSVSGTLGDNLKKLAKSDARYYRELGELAKAPPAKSLKGKAGKAAALGGAKKALPAGKEAKPAAKKLGFAQSDFLRRSQRTSSIKNPQVKQKAQRLYGKILDLESTPRQLRSMFRKAGKSKATGKTAAQRRSEREHRDMLALSKRLFR